ncbi:Rho guanine nucleotide exchange factor [Thalictrum thalictroides]|uniref:Rho guanine nucleotide exchange factor n=1 Tax=Thalictrum thalictroides TaxID=46969 RepID=A0A7J6UTS2_THATH|nr:Rho guanine nucleotide exchange factor [Thalictrum thalictroides]
MASFNVSIQESSDPAGKKPQKDSSKNAPLDGNVVFLVFCREDPVSEEELRDYLSSTYGDVVEEIVMEEIDILRQEQPLYARVTFRSQATVDAIMDGNERIQFVINGKHVWARIYIPRE